MTAALPTRLIGRDEETRALAEILDTATSGRSAIALVEGEAGIGKSRLLAQVIGAARRRGLQVLHGQANELEWMRPFGLAADALGCTRRSSDTRRSAIAELLGSSAGSGAATITVTSDPGLQFRVVDAFTDLLEELALDGPLLLALDDLQWADPSSLLMLGAAARCLTDQPVALIAGYRPAPHRDDLQRLTAALRAAGAAHLSLSPLTAAQAWELAAEIVSAIPGPTLLANVEGAAGNPLFVTELVSTLYESGAIIVADGRAEVAEASLPPTLRLTILHRLRFLPDDTMSALRSAAVLGSPFSLTDLATVTGRTAVDLGSALTHAIRAHVLEDDGLRFRFRHDLIRESIYEDVPPAARSGLHRDAGTRLAEAGASTMQVAEHVARGATVGDTEAVEWLARASRESAMRSPAVAADLLQRAIELMAARDPDREPLMLEQANSLMWSGRIADSRAMCRTVIDQTRDAQVTRLAQTLLGVALLASARPREGLRQFEQVCASPLVSAAERANALAWASIARLWLGDLDGCADAAEQTRAAADGTDAHGTQATTAYAATRLAKTSLAVVAELRGRLPEALNIIDDATRLMGRSPAVEHRYPIHATRGFLLVELDRPGEARSTLDAGARRNADVGTLWHLPSYQVARAFEHFVSGDWDDALAEIETSLDLARDTGQLYSFIIATSLAALISVHRNHLARAHSSLVELTDQLAEIDSRYFNRWAIRPRALLLEAEGRIGDAYALLTQCWDDCVQSGIALEYRHLGVDLVRLAVTCEDECRAREVADAVAGAVAASGSPSFAAAALHCRGLVDRDADLLQQAVDTYSGVTRPLELAVACEDAGTAFAGRGDRDATRRLIERAIEIYERLDAARDLARAESALRKAGLRRGRRGKRSRPRSGWESLTETEWTVAELVAQGLSNPQIGDRLYISRRTVQTHVAHMFDKLSVTSRAQLATTLTEHRAANRPADASQPRPRRQSHSQS